MSRSSESLATAKPRTRPPASRPAARFFRTRAALRGWFERHHSSASEIWIGYYKRGTGRVGLTYPEVVEEALCFGWIDGQVRSLDDRSYANRYTPRRPGSQWSEENLRKFEQLRLAGRVHRSVLAEGSVGQPGPSSDRDPDSLRPRPGSVAAGQRSR